MTFPERLRYLRQAAGLTQPQLAEKAGISSSVISLYERGETEPGLYSLIGLAKALDVSLDYLAEGRINE